MGLRGPIKQRSGRMHLEVVAPPSTGLSVKTKGWPPAAPARWTKGQNEDRLMPTSLREWDRLWSSDIAKFWKPSDAATVERLVEAEDERRRLRRACRAKRTVAGSKGQATLNPLNGALKDAIREIQWCEDRLGLNPASRQRLGLQKLAGAKTAAELNALVDGPDANGKSQEEDELGIGTDYAEA
jgi:P27 family predicted phage terminase small subunit